MITVDPTTSTSPAEQIRRQIADLIRSGDLAGGQRLPAIRQLAGDLRVAAGTVAKAYSALETDGLIETSRARGTRVADGRAQPEAIHRAAASYVEAVRGLTLEEALGAVRAAWSR